MKSRALMRHSGVPPAAVATLALAGSGWPPCLRSPIWTMDSKLAGLPPLVWGWGRLPSSCARHAGG
jgi:hypothetical protein